MLKVISMKANGSSFGSCAGVETLPAHPVRVSLKITLKITHRNHPMVFQLSTDDSRKQDSLINASGEIGELGSAIAQLQQGDFAARWDALKVLQRNGKEAIAPLLSLLETLLADPDNEDWEGVWFVVRALSSYPDVRSWQPLLQILQTAETDELVQGTAIAVAQQDIAIVPLLAPLMATTTGRSRVVRVLAQMPHPTTLPMLLALAKDEDVSVRSLAIEALSYTQHPAAVALLEGAVQDPVAAIRKAATAGLGTACDGAIAHHRVALVAPLLADLNPAVAEQAAVTLGRLSHVAAVAPLQQALRSPLTPAALRPVLCRSLGWFPHPATLKVLQETLHSNPDAALALEIIPLLGRMDAPDLIPQASQILQDLLTQTLPHPPQILEVPAVRRAIAHSLGQLHHPSALACTAQLLWDGDRGVQLHTLTALKHWPPTQVFAHLQAHPRWNALSPIIRQDLATLLPPDEKH